MDDDDAAVVGYFLFVMALVVVASVSGWIIFSSV
jgi:hypothetical protein